MEKKYGFVYIWYDKKHKRYYLGCRWGNENDGYICSSPWMKRGYNKRPKDFKRKILAKVYTNKKDLLEEEYKWLSLIKNEELGKKYYNLHNHHFGHWSTDEAKKLTVGQKISASPNRRENISKSNKGKKRSEKTKQKISESVSKLMTKEHRKLLSDKIKNIWLDDEYRKKYAGCNKGRVLTPEHKTKISLAQTGKRKAFKKRECPHCHLIGTGPNMKRYHFDKCRLSKEK
jgi:hypothetical protein